MDNKKRYNTYDDIDDRYIENGLKERELILITSGECIHPTIQIYMSRGSV